MMTTWRTAVVSGLLTLFLLLASSRAVIFVSTGDPSYNTNAPAGALASSGWQYEGRWIGFLATPVAANYFIAARHIGGTVGDTFNFGGSVYHTIAVFDAPDADLRLWQVAETFPIYAPLYTNSDETGKHCVVIGTGTDRGLGVVVRNSTNGWEWGADNRIERWGENVVTKTAAYPDVGSLLVVNFDRNGGRNEGGLSPGDSSGGLFIQEGTSWKLAGIHYSVDGPFSRDGTSNTQFDGALVDLRGLYYLSGTNAWTLVPTNYPVAIPSSFYSSRISANISWIRSILDFVPSPEIQITSPPSVTNALASINNIAVIKPGDTVGFSVDARSTNRLAVSCRWNFGDGDATSECSPSHVFTNCGAYHASVTLTDDVALVTTGLTVAVACPLNVTAVKLQAKFTRVGADSCSLKGTLPGLPADFALSNAVASVVVGGTAATFPLAKGRSANSQGNISFKFNQQAASWTFTARLKGNLQDSWANYGVTSSVTNNASLVVPLVILLDADTIESFEAEPAFSYSNKSGATGTATYPPK